MAINITLRLIWHDSGWNGSICRNPSKNIYCGGSFSYISDTIAKERDIEWESRPDVSGKHCSLLDRQPPCCVSCNAFGKEATKLFVSPPSFFDCTGVLIDLPPATSCTWDYESMYSDEAKTDLRGEQQYNSDKRLSLAKQYFGSLTPDKTIVIYYSNYSNPFSEEELNKYVVVGISKLKEIGDILYFNDVSQQISEKYSGGFVWQMPIRSAYPEEGFYIPYDKYADDPDILERLVFVPDNSRNFKFATRTVGDDDMINLIERFISITNVLIELDDGTHVWKDKKKWLIGLLSDIWKSRGDYPGLPQVLAYLNREDLTQSYLEHSAHGNSVKAYKDIISEISKDKTTSRKILLLGESKSKLLTEVLPLFNLSRVQISSLIDFNGEDNSVTASADDIIANPYILCEQYVGSNPDDSISFYQIDNGILHSSQNDKSLFDAGSAERFRALCVEALKRDNNSFTSAQHLLDLVNVRTSQMHERRKYAFNSRYFDVDRDTLSKALQFRKHSDGNLYLYLKDVYEDELLIRKTLENLISRPDIHLKLPVTTDSFYNHLYDDSSLLKDEDDYKFAIRHQAEVCSQLFTKGLCVISGSAGTGKTTLIKSFINQILKTEGSGTCISLLAPTGKAADRIREKIGNESGKNRIARTIHSLLKENGWLNKNNLFKRKGGTQVKGVSTFIIDESSMIDLGLFATLFRAIKWNNIKRLILIGDPNQLPPIGRGKVFSDIIEWLKVNNEERSSCLGYLEHNIRLLNNAVINAGRGIPDLAQILMQERQTDGTISKFQREKILLQIQNGGKIDNDLTIVYWNSPDELNQLINDNLHKDLDDNELPNDLESKWLRAIDLGDCKKNPYLLQVISPFRGEEHGTDSLNIMLQKLLNGKNSNKILDGIAYFDKVIQCVNRSYAGKYSIKAYNFITEILEPVELFNGEMGFTSYDLLDKTNWHKHSNISRFVVKFNDKHHLHVQYSKNNPKPSDNLELAYAISVHKSQGSEFDIVYAVIPKKRSILLTMELLYTAVTRAQKKLVLFLQDDVETLSRLTKIEQSAIRRINSSVFHFVPIPHELSYPISCFDEYKVHSTFSEYFVRSKSEVIIANSLHQAELDFFYEKPLKAKDNTMFLPDFTVMFQGEEHYWEHCGLLNLPDYAAHWNKKELWYNKHFPGKLLITREGNDLSSQIKKIMFDNFHISL